MEENVNQKDKEKVEEEMIEQAFQQLLNDYLPTRHIRASNAAQASPTLCIPWLWHRLFAPK